MSKRFTDRIYAYGIKAGLPYGLLRGIVDTWDRTGNIFDTAKRRRAASLLLADSKWRGYFPRDTNVRPFAPGEIPGLDRLVEIGQKIRSDRKRAADHGADLGKPHPFEMHLTAKDFKEYPEILEIALSRPLIDIVTDYFGAVPRLAYADIWVSPKWPLDNVPFNSQQFHLDKPHFGIATLFLNLSEVGVDNGPFTFFPADTTRKICKRIKYEKRYHAAKGYVSDEEVIEAADGEPLIEVTGPVGAGAFADPTEILHYGSRCRKGERVVFVMRFIPGYRNWKNYTRHFVTRPEADPNIVQLVLADTPALAN